jgi:hypothetical protein
MRNRKQVRQTAKAFDWKSRAIKILMQHSTVVYLGKTMSPREAIDRAKRLGRVVDAVVLPPNLVTDVKRITKGNQFVEATDSFKALPIVVFKYERKGGFSSFESCLASILPR